MPMRAASFAICIALVFSAFPQVFAEETNAMRELYGAYLRMQTASQVAEQAKSLGAEKEGIRYRDGVLGAIKERLVPLFEDADAAQKEFAAFINLYAKAAAENDGKFLASFAKNIGIEPAPGSYNDLSEAIISADLLEDIDAAGKFLAKLNEAKKSGASARSKKKKMRNRNLLRESEADAGEFIEAKDDGGSSLRSFGAQRKARREKAIREAEAGMAQVAAERKVADDEYNAKKQTAAAAEAAAQKAQAEKLAAAQQEAVQQDQNSWKTRIKNVVIAGVGAAGSAFAGSVGGRLGEAAAEAVFKDDKRPPR